MYLQANQKLRHLRVKQFNLLSIATTLNKKLDTDYLLDETIACIPVFHKIETSLMNLEATILEMKLKFSAIADDSKTKQDIDVEQKIEKELQKKSEEDVQRTVEEKFAKKVIQDEQEAETDIEILAKKEVEIEIKTTSDKKINDVVEVEKQGSKSNDLLKNDGKSEVVANKRDIKVENIDYTEKTSIEKSEIITDKGKEKLRESVAAKGSKVQVPKIKIIKDAAKAWEGKEALKKAFKARDWQ